MKASETALGVPVIIGPGRVGQSLANALRNGGVEVELRGRQQGISGLGGRIVLLCVPDAEINLLADEIGEKGPPPSLLGHSSGATPLALLSGSAAGGLFSVHPLQTVPDGETELRGCPAAVAGNSESALEVATRLAKISGMRSFAIAEKDRAIYHAAASIASNFLVTIEQTAADLLGGIAVENPRQILEPLVRRSLDNWIDRGSSALTGPIARGDESTVEAHRLALAERSPDLLGFYDALAARTRDVASEGSSQ